MRNILNILNDNKTRRVLVLLSIILFVGRMAFPGLKYPFVFVYALSLICFAFEVNQPVLRKTVYLLKTTWQFSVLGMFLALGMALSVNIINRPLTELISFIIILSFAIQIVLIKLNIKSFMDSIIDYFIYFSTGIALLGIIRFLLTFNSAPYTGTSLVSDYNSYALFSAFGLVGIILKIKPLFSRRNIYWANIFLFILYLSILFSYSRRGIVILALALTYLTVILVLSFENKTKFLQFKQYLPFYFFSIIFSSLFLLFTFSTNGAFKKTISEKYGIKYSSLKTFTSTLIYRYSTILRQDVKYSDLTNRYFGLHFDSKDPDSWGIYGLKTVYPLTGRNRHIIPPGTKGILLDSTLKVSSSYSDARKYIKVYEDTLIAGVSMRASVFCYLSEDFNGKARLFLKGSLDGQVLYDMTKKGEWQELIINKISKKGIAKFYMTLSKDDAVNFSSMKEYAVFAYPSLQKIEFNKYDPRSWGRRNTVVVYPLEGSNVEIVPHRAKGILLDSTSNSSSRANKAHTYTQIFYDTIKKGDQVELSVYCYMSEDFEGEMARLFCQGAAGNQDLYDMSNKGIWQKMSIIVTSKGGVISGYLYMSRDNASNFGGMKGYVIFSFSDHKIIPNEISLSNSRNYISPHTSSLFLFNEFISDIHNMIMQKQQSNDSLVIEDDIIDELLQNNFAGERIARWKYAYDLFSEYPLINKIFGGGFTYMYSYGERFWGSKERLDYPHNPIISSFLYSGIIGGLFYIYFLIITFWYYWKYRKHHMVFFIMYLVTFFFAFFSGNSHFNIPIFAFLSFIPFITRYVVKEKGDKNLIEKKPE